MRISKIHSNIIYLALAIFVGLAVFLAYDNFSARRHHISCPEKFSFISPDLNCNEDPHDQTESLQSSVQQVIDKDVLAGEAYRVSVFYRDLDNRQWFGINENDNFAPGSLLKLPLAVAYYKLSEIQANIFDQKITFAIDKNQGDLNDMQFTKPTDALESGTVYSVADLIGHLMKYSDNNAVPILTGSLNQAFLNKVYVDLGVYIPTTGGIEQDFISVKTYGSIFRSLYNASYLNQKSSNELLGIMAQSSFRSGIVAGVPSTVTVSNKFGERFLTVNGADAPDSFELHDCGIVYVPNSPYILCVMTKGDDFNQLSKVIADISKKIYDTR